MEGGLGKNLRRVAAAGMLAVGAGAAAETNPAIAQGKPNVGTEAPAKGKKQEYPPGYDDMLKAARELHEKALKEKELRDAKPYRDALDAQKRIFKQNGKNNPRFYEYQDALAQKFNITDWMSDEGRKIMTYLNNWYNEN